jgi:cytochrome P450
MEDMSTAQLDVNLFDPSVVADPYDVYEEVRAAGRVVWNDLIGGWMVPGYDDCVEVLARGDGRFEQMNTAELTPWFEAPNMISANGEAHDRLRRVLKPQFTRQSIAAWEDRVGSIVERLMRPLIEKGQFDIVSDFTLIPTVVVAEMMGVPKERHEDFRRWSHIIAGNVSYGHEDPETAAKMLAAGKEANAYLADELERHRVEDFDDLISIMMASTDMNEDEIISTGMLLVLAGYDTTAKFLANALVVLNNFPDQRAALVADPTLLPGAIEEILRWCGVTHVLVRNTVADTEIGGTKIRAGDTVYVMKAAGNRDAARFADPLRFDIHRQVRSHLGFGFGPHLCLGAPLARLEAKAALEQLLLLAPEYSVHDIDYGSGLIVRGPERGYVEVNKTKN